MAMIPKLAVLARNTYGYNTATRRIMLEGTVGAYKTYTNAVFAHHLKLKNIGKYVVIYHLL